MVPPCLFGFVLSHHVSQAAHAVHGAGRAGRAPVKAPKGHPHGGNSGQPAGCLTELQGGGPKIAKVPEKSGLTILVYENRYNMIITN